MAILKHLSSKSANYGRAVEYLMYEQDRLTNRSIEDEDGRLIMRENFLIDSLECNVSTFDAECRMLNNRYHKNQNYNDIKSHHYIISFDPKDAIEGKLTMMDAQQIGMDYASRNFPGHQAIVCTHDDGEHGSGNMHVHIIFNSLRKRDVKRQYFMERKCDCRAGYKHHLTDRYLEYLKIDLMDICKRKKLHQVDLKTPAKKRVTEKEYWAKERGKEAKGESFRTNKDILRSAIEYASARSRSEKEFAHILRDKYSITFKTSRGRYSYILPNRQKAIRGRTLGTDYTEKYLQTRFKDNAKNKNRDTIKNNVKTRGEETTRRPTSASMERTRTTETATEIKPKNYSEKSAKKRIPTEQVPSNLTKLDSVRRRNVKYPPAFTMDTRLPFVRDLQISAITTTNRAIDRGIKINNLKEMADTIIYMEEHGIKSRDALDNAYKNTRDKLYNARSALKSSENSIDAINEQIHYTGLYYVNKDVYNSYMKARNKERFRFEHRKEIVLYEAAMRYIKEHTEEGTLPSRAYIKTAPGKIPTLSTLKSTRDKLIKKQKPIRERYYSAKKNEKRLYAIKRSVDNMLREPSLEHQRRRSRDNSLER